MNLAFAGPIQDGRPKLPGSLHVNRRLDQWLAFLPEGAVRLTPGKVELGQGILTALAQIAAEELDVALSRIRVVAASTPGSPDEAVTSGSLSVQESGMAIRHACAEARAILLSVLAQRSGVSPHDIRVEDGAFLAPDGRTLGSYWSMADAGLLAAEASPDIEAKPATARRIAGTSAPRLDLPEKVFGSPRFIHDLRLPGMRHARVVRPASRGAVLLAVREGALPGDAVVHRDGSFLAVLAPREQEAEAAALRLAGRAEWQAAETLPPDGAVEAWLDAAPAEESLVAERVAETPPAAHRIARRFFRPFVTHASIGTSCAVALWQDGRMHLWTHSQGIYNLRADLAKAMRLPAETFLIQHVEGAGCYGHNGADDVALEAALVARAHPGIPVRLLWSRAEELGWGPASPAMLVAVQAEAAADGTLLRWSQRVTSNGHSGRPGRGKHPTLLAASQLADPFPVPNAINPPLAGGGGAQRNAVPGYRVPALDVRMAHLQVMPLRTSALRGLGALANVWAIESVMDELAAAAGADPLAHRLRHLDDARARDVLARAAAMAGWESRARREGFGLGLAVARYKGTGAWCAAVAEVEAAERVFCRRLWLAADVGEVVSPDGTLNQIEGGAIQATSLCLLEAVRHDARGVTSDSWEGYPILRFSEVPRVAAELLARPEAPPLGAGECSMGPVIGAIANAIADALGVRPTHWPFTPENLAKAMDTA
ncbi:molybdopterin cofactor-binding domain-containing protein [Falsiroseomonas selenitidurans]|uniref:Xanthine dehydrogenase family protein molybdopterin-binding subunit n=1 Tax=Falsiroseomonas selenitidurans TaxID=2716335 RepID=A0ABX1E5H7_9PROT|nr:molybdopterin cofactor-binding domain-containing protein [Falsiroseomonas selenitidurans]NKC30772.1 xanthine dehydrogenase family protein molybdopterin-binding subunit [Falsiroseomonas selenitidurans]